MTLEFEVDVDYLTDGGIKDMPTWVKLNDEDGEHTSTIYVNSSSYWCVVGENAKLRELVKNALDYISHEGCGVDNPYNGSANWWCEDCSHFDRSTCSYVIVQAAKELGVMMD